MKGSAKNLITDFPLLMKHKIVYLDNAATTQKPKIVIDTLTDYYENYNANAHRGVYKLSEKSTALLEDSRKVFAKFINANPDEIIFTKNATEGFNQISRSIACSKTIIESAKIRQKKDDSTKFNMVTTEIEHHSNFLPWQQICRIMGMEFRVARYDPNEHSLEDISKLVDKNTISVSFTLMSNVSGLITDAKNIISKIRKKNPNTIIVVDATQFVAHNRLDIKDIDANFACFSCHKIYGTTGVGIVYGKKKLLNKIEPFLYGGNMIKRVGLYDSEWSDDIDKFEAGTLDIAGIAASAQAIKYLEKNDFKSLIKKEDELKNYLLKELRKLSYVKIIGHNTSAYGPVVSFSIKGVHPHDLATICDRYDVCIRAGHHCAQPFMDAIKEKATARASLSFYNTFEDIDRLIFSIKKSREILK